MSTRTFFRSILLISCIAFSTLINCRAGEYPLTLTAYRGTTPVLDGHISEGEYADAEWVTGMAGWHSDTNEGISCEDSLDLSVKIWYKHDGTYVYFAFDVTDNIIYGTDTEAWLPDRNANAHELGLGDGGWPWFGDGLEIMMNPSYTWDETKKSVGDGTIWQTICNTYKSYAGGLGTGGLIQGVPLNEYAWTNYEAWYDNEYMKASVRIKSGEEGSGYVVEWRISPDPCMQTGENSFVDLDSENRVGINFEFEDVDGPEDGLGTRNLEQFRHVDYMTKLPDYRKNIAKGFATLVLTPEKIYPDFPAFTIAEDFETSLDIPADYIISTEGAAGVYVDYGAICDNNSLILADSSSGAMARVEVPIGDLNDTLHIQFTLEPAQDTGAIQFDLREHDLNVLSFGLKNNGKFYYCENGTEYEWLDYAAHTKYSLQCIASIESNRFDLILNSDTLKNISFCDSTAGSVDNLSMLSPAAPSGRYRIDNLVLSNVLLSDLVFPFDECVEDNTGMEGAVAEQVQIKLYPNPTSGYLYIEFAAPHPEPIIVTDLYGREVSRLNGTRDEGISFDLSSLPPGLYLFHFRKGMKRQYKKLQLIR